MNCSAVFLRIGLCGCAAAAFLTASSAQTSTATKATPKEGPKETVTVKAIKPSVQVLPDRTVYSLEKDIQSSTSTLSDVLRNLPSVDVDIQGNVSLRSDSNVTILIDGKQSPLLAGNRADALQQIPASMVDRIEVITNPSAEFRAEGSAGVINIILKKDKELVSSGVVRVNVGDQGRVNASVSGNVKLGRVNLNGGYGEQRFGREYTSSTQRSDGTTLTSSQDVSGKWTYSGRYVYSAATFDIDGRNQAELGGSYNRYGGHTGSHEHDIASADGSDIGREGLAYWLREGAGAQFNYTHKFATEGEEFTLVGSGYTSWGRNSSDYTNADFATGVPDYWQSRRSTSSEVHTELKADYTLPFPSQGKLKAGYALQNDSSVSDNRGLWRDPTRTDWADDSTFTNNFSLDRTIHAGYVSYERKFGRFGVMGGLRVEQDFLHTDLKTTGEVHDTSNLGVFPNLHMSYALTDTQQLNASYSRRTNRPGVYALNPARYSSDAFNVWAGNPYLKPEQVDSFEASYRYTADKFDIVTTGYYRATYKGITNVYRYLSDTLLLTTFDNLARRMASGVETNLNATLLPGLTLRANTAVTYTEFNPGAQGVGEKQSGINWNVRGGIEWQVTPADLVQFNTNYASKQRFAQGYTKPTLSGDLGIKHRFDGGLAAVLSVNNLFDSWKSDTVLDTPGLHQTGQFSARGRIVYVGLVYTFGGAKDTQAITGNSDSGGGAAGGVPGGQ